MSILPDIDIKIDTVKITSCWQPLITTWSPDLVNDLWAYGVEFDAQYLKDNGTFFNGPPPIWPNPKECTFSSMKIKR